MNGNGNRVAEFRTGKGWSQEELAHRARISNMTVYRIEKGVHTPFRITQDAIARALGLPTEIVFPESVEEATA